MIPTLADIRSSVWAMSPFSLEVFVQSVAEATTRQRPSSMEVVPFVKAAETTPENGVAHVPVKGVILRGQTNPFLSFFGIDNVGQDDIRDSLAAAIADEAVSEIVLDIDSPGGEAQGMPALAAMVRDSSKPTRAVISGTGASAAYWLASQAGEVIADPDSIVGSIGAYSTITDTSAEFTAAGRKVHVVGSGQHKGAGIPGTEVTPDQIAMHQAIVQGIAAGFSADVASGRGLDTEALSKLDSGAHWLGKQAISLGLVDSLSSSSREPETTEAPKEATMAPVAATLAELDSAYPGEQDFILGQLRAESTNEQAALAWSTLKSDRTQERVTALEAENARLKAAVPAPETVATVEAVANVDSGEDDDLHGDFMEQSKAYQRINGCSIAQAIKTIARKNPELHSEWVAAQNPHVTRQRRKEV